MNVKKYVRALLCLYITIQLPINNVHAQALKVGDTLPDELWSMPLQVVNHPEGKETLTLSEYKDKLIILDFWATWCSPCIAALPHLDSLQKQFKDEIQIISVSYQTRTEISSFIEKYTKRIGRYVSLPKMVDDNLLRNLFPHTYLPHYVWIDTQGKVIAFTGPHEVIDVKIAAILHGKQAGLTAKTDPEAVLYDDSKPLFLNGNGGEVRNLIYHTILTGYTEGLPSGYLISGADSVNGMKITATNLSLVSLFRLAYGEGKIYLGRNRTIITEEAGQSLQQDIQIGKDNLLKNGNRYCFEIVVPYSQRINAFRIMQQTLSKNFPDYTAKLELRTMRCLVLERTSSSDKTASQGGPEKIEIDRWKCEITNASIKEFLGRLNVLFMQKSPIPIVDGTGIKSNVDLILNADLTNMNSINEELKRYDLRFIESDHELEMLVLAKK